HFLENNISPFDWFHFIIAALYHDIGYIRGLCDGDKDGEYIKNLMGDTVHLPSHSTDAALAPYHIDRAKLYSRVALSKIKYIDHDYISNLIERTRFPVPSNDKYRTSGDLPGLLRAADLIGQVADINYTKKSDALFSELEEIGSAKELGYETGYDLKVKLPVFFKTNISPYIKEALKYLNVTESGRKWIRNLIVNDLIESPSTTKEIESISFHTSLAQKAHT
ncbi:MAG: metal-dependent phosphohydrolase, partial [Bacteroidetes bacterium]